MSSVEINTTFNRANCYYDAEHSLVICSHCKHALAPDDVATHLQMHNITLTSRELSGLRSLPAFDHAGFARSGTPHFPVGGLDLHVRGYYCPIGICPFAFASKTALERHCCADHGNSNTAELFTRGPYQDVFGMDYHGTKVKASMSEEEQIQRVLALAAFLKPPERAATDEKASWETSLLIRRYGWLAFLRQVDDLMEFRRTAQRSKFPVNNNEVWFRQILEKHCKSVVKMLLDCGASAFRIMKPKYVLSF